MAPSVLPSAAADGATCAELIRRHRTRKGLTQADLAAAAGVSQPTVSDWERGASAPRATRVILVARALGLTELELHRAIAAQETAA